MGEKFVRSMGIGDEQVWDKKSKELEAAIYDDWKRKAIDIAKKRAAAQGVDYPTFANLVSVAHLKPVEYTKPGEQDDDDEPKHIYRGIKAPAWSFDPTGTTTSGNKLSDGGAENYMQQQLAQAVDLKACKVDGKIPISRDVFVKKWRRLNKNMSLQMESLGTLQPCDFARIFKVEIPPFLLADILETMCTCFQVPDMHPEGATQELHPLEANPTTSCHPRVQEMWVVDMLESLAKCGRFTLAVGLLGGQTRGMVQRLIAHVHNSPWRHESNLADSKDSFHHLSRLQALEKLYKVGRS